MIRDAELNLLVRLCTSAIRGEQQRGPATSCDWPRLVQLARRHRIQGLAWLGLSGGVTDSQLPGAMELLEEARSIAHQNLLAIAAATRLRDEFNKEGLAFVFLKGLALAALAYPQAMLKMSTDIDILIDEQQIETAEQCLQRLGYKPVGRRRSGTRRAWLSKEWTWVGADDVVLDVHTRLTDSPALLPMIIARSRTREVEVSTGIALPTLTQEELFAYLCVHGTWSAWFRLKWVADVAALLSQRSGDEIRELHRASQRLGAGRCPDVTLLVVEEVFGPCIPADLLSSAARDPFARLLAHLSIRELMQVREPLDRPFGTVLIHVGQLFADRGFTFPLHELRRQCTALIA